MRKRTNLGFEVFEDRRLLASSAELLRDINTHAGEGDSHTASSSPDYMSGDGNLQLYMAQDQEVSSRRRSIWSTDGTPEGTQKILDASLGRFGHSAAANGWLYFIASVGKGAPMSFYRTKGTAASTEFLKPAPSVTGGSKRINDLVALEAVGDKVFAIYGDGSDTVRVESFDSSTQIWTEEELDVGWFSLWRETDSPAIFRGNIYFGGTVLRQHRLFQSDGTKAGTRSLALPEGIYDIIELRATGDKLFFLGKRTSGTALLYMDSDHEIHEVSSSIGNFNDRYGETFADEDRYYLVSEVYDPVTEESSVRVTVTDGKKIDSIDRGDAPPSWAGTRGVLSGVIRGRYYYYGSHTRTIWSTDGTPQSKRAVFQANQDPVTQISNDGDYLYITTKGNEVWRSDGTPEGTVRLAKLNVELKRIQPSRDHLVITADCEQHGRELFRISSQPKLLGDLNSDFRVGFDDFLVLSANFGSVDAAMEDGDFDEDGVVNFTDFLLLAANFGKDLTNPM